MTYRNKGTKMNQPLETNRLALGGNSPPSQLETLQQQHATLLDVANKRMANAARIPKVCATEDMAAKITDMIKLLNSARSEIEKTHKIEKAPWLEGGRVVDGLFNPLVKKLTDAAREAGKPLTTFQLAKAAEVRRKAEEEAERSRLEAEKHANAGAALESENMHAAAGVAFAEAEAYDKRAENAEAVQEAKPSQLVQTRTKSGAVASVRTRWVGEVTDLAELDLNTLRYFFSPDALQSALGNYIKAGHRDLKGAKIYETAAVGVR